MINLLEDYCDYLRIIRGRSLSTVSEYRLDISTFIRFISNRKKIKPEDVDVKTLDGLNLSDVHSFIFYLEKERNNSTKTRRRKIASLKGFFVYLKTVLKLIENNPFEGLEQPSVPKRQPTFLSLEESINLLRSVNGRNKERDLAMITLFLHCGLRLSEMSNLNIDSINNDELRVIGKGNKERIIYLNDQCIKVVENYLKVRPKVNINAMFVSEQNNRISCKTIQFLIKKYIKASGLSNKYSTHKLRHTAATLMYQHGDVDIRALQEILGHENIATTQIYTHLNRKKIKEALESNPLSKSNF